MKLNILNKKIYLGYNDRFFKYFFDNKKLMFEHSFGHRGYATLNKDFFEKIWENFWSIKKYE